MNILRKLMAVLGLQTQPARGKQPRKRQRRSGSDRLDSDDGWLAETDEHGWSNLDYIAAYEVEELGSEDE